MNPLILKTLRMALAAFILVSLQTFSVAQEQKKGHSHEKAEIHGGTVAMTAHHHFEVVFKQDAIQVYLYDGMQNPLSASGVEGEVTLKFKKGEPKTLALKYASMHHMMDEKEEHMHGEQPAAKDHHDMMMMGYLVANVDLSQVEPGTMKAVFVVKGLSDKQEKEATFTETFDGFTRNKKSHHDEHMH